MDRNLYRAILGKSRVGGIKLIIVNFRTVSLSDNNYSSEAQEQMRIDEACNQISEHCIHVNPNDLSKVAPELAQKIMQLMTEHLLEQPVLEKNPQRDLQLKLERQIITKPFNFDLAHVSVKLFHLLQLFSLNLGFAQKFS